MLGGKLALYGNEMIVAVGAMSYSNATVNPLHIAAGAFTVTQSKALPITKILIAGAVYENENTNHDHAK